MKKPTIIIVDDHQIFREALNILITRENIATVIGEASNGVEFLELLLLEQPDLVLMDIDMPGMDGLEATQKALELVPEIKIIAFSMFRDQESYFKMISRGAKGFILKSCSINELEKAIHCVFKGERYFSNDLMKEIINNFGRENINIQSEIESIIDKKKIVIPFNLTWVESRINWRKHINPKPVKISELISLEKK